MKTMHVDGVIETVVTTALVEFRDDLAKLKKKMVKKGLDADEADQHDAAAKEALNQLGWKPTPGKGRDGRVEVTDDTLPLPFGDASAERAPHHARVQCASCARHFIVPAGDTLRACPDCSTIHRVKSDEDGTVHQCRPHIRPPEDILALMVREQSEDLAPLTKRELTKLNNWRQANPDHLTNGEHVEPGQRVADPGVVGSGNPHWIDCARTVGNDCAGFEATDTPGAALCPRCGQKYVVEILEEKVHVRSWTLDDEVDARDGE